jgi:hypothetical protein
MMGAAFLFAFAAGIADASMGGDSGPIGWQSFMPIMQVGIDDLLSAVLVMLRLGVHSLIDSQSWLLTHYGNSGVLSDTYAAAAAYCAFLDAAPAEAIENGLGDWMNLEPSALSLTGRGFQTMSYAAFANVSAALGHSDAAARYASAASNVSAMINARFLNAATGVYSDPVQHWNATQCGQALPLYLGIVPPATTGAVAAILADNLAAHGGHLQVGQ